MDNEFDLGLFEATEEGYTISEEYKRIVDIFFLIIKTDLDNNIVYLNKKAEELINLDLEQVMCANFNNFFKEEDNFYVFEKFDRKRYFEVIREEVKDKSDMHIEYMYILKDVTKQVELEKERDRQAELNKSYEHVLDIIEGNKKKTRQNKEIISIDNNDYLEIIKEIQTLKKAVDEERERRRTCDLTGALNKSAYMEDIQYIKDKGLAIIDIDFFKQVNDTFGHSVGDSVLKEVADRIKSTLRKEDRFYRFGGEEFVVISDNNSIENIAKRIKNVIEEKEFETVGRKTVSIGVSFIRNDFQEAFEEADKQLYLAKENGRNQIRVKRY